MADPTFYVGDSVNRAYQASINGTPYEITSGTISVWNPSDALVVSDQAMTVAGTIATYQIGTGANVTAGIHKVEVALVFANSQGTLRFHETYTLVAVYP